MTIARSQAAPAPHPSPTATGTSTVKAKPGGPISGDRVRSYIERVEKLMEERQAIGSDIRDVFAEAKGVGYDVKTLRKLVQLRAIDAADRAEAEALLDTYAHAIGMDLATTEREPSEDELVERASRIVAEVDRCMALVGPDGEPPKIEAIKALIECSAGKASKLRGLVEQRVAERFSRSNANDGENEKPEGGDAVVEMTAEDLGDWQWLLPKRRGEMQFAAKVKALAATVKPSERVIMASPLVDDLTIPEFLRAKPQKAAA